MFTDRSGNPTDDADAMLNPCDTFAPGDSAYKCGHGEFREIPCCCDWEGRLIPGHPGCRHCNPPDYELKPTGFGIERFDSPEWAAARRHFGVMRSLVFGLPADAHPVVDYGHWLDAWACKAGWSARRLKHSERVWDRLCGECVSHSEAKAKYEAWAKRAVAVKYRDQK